MEEGCIEQTKIETLNLNLVLVELVVIWRGVKGQFVLKIGTFFKNSSFVHFVTLKIKSTFCFIVLVMMI